MAFLMKGKHWSDRHKFRVPLQYPVVVQPKVDEIRVRVSVDWINGTVHYRSYADKPLFNLSFADGIFVRAAYEYQLTEFDCGFLCNGSFDDSRSFVRSSRNFPERLRDAPKQFILYDLPQSNKEYNERLRLIESVVRHAQKTSEYLVQLPHWIAHTSGEVEHIYENLRTLRYEGAMVKTLHHKYQIGKRSQDWLKMKPEDTCDGKIIGVVEAVATVNNPETGVLVGDPIGRVGSVIVRMEDGSEARPHGIPHELGRAMLLAAELYIGEWCEFAFMERDTQGGYRHPVFRRLRDSKD